MSLPELIAAEFESLEVFLANYDFSNQEIQAEIFDEVIATLQKLPQENGSFVISDRAKAIILSLEDRVIQIIESGKYAKQYNKLIKNFGTLEEIRKEVNALVNVKDKLKVFKANTSPIRKGYINQLSESLGSKKTFGINVTDPLKSILFEHSTLGLPVKSAAQRLFEVAIGSEPKGGKLARYSHQIAHDALFGFTGAIDKEIGAYIGAKDVNYLGGLQKNSRPQCVRWVQKFGGFIPGDQLQAEINWAKANGEGYSKHLPDLTIATFPIVKGGHECKHRVLLTNGKAGKQIQDIEKEYKRKSDEFIKGEEKTLEGKSKILYDKNKAKVNDLIKRYGK